METASVVSPIRKLAKLFLSLALALSLLATVGVLLANQRDAVLVKDINPAGDSMPDTRLVYFSVIADTLYFVASHPDHGPELWKSDGTEAGTLLVKDINPGPDALSPADLVNFNGTLFFRASDGVDGEELWSSDGTEAGTVLFKDINPADQSSTPLRFHVVDNLLFFSADDGTYGRELWKSDGTEPGTVRVEDINAGPQSSSPTFLSHVNSTLFFVADDGENGEELWRSDGTTSGTELVRDINPGEGSSSPRELIPMNGVLFFTADDGANGRELWKSDGTQSGTVMVADIMPVPSIFGPFDLTNVGGTLFFRADDGIHGSELWASDGTDPGTDMVTDIVLGASGSRPRHLTGVGGTLFFGANDGEHGVELWKSDGTPAGTVLIEDINPGESPSIVSGEFKSVDNTLYFAADDGTNGVELWKSDGAAWNTIIVTDIHTSGSSAPASLTELGVGLVFVADDGVSGKELWFVELTNQPPTAEAAGPYAGNEGATIALDGTAGDPDGDELELTWSVNTSLCTFSDSSVEDPALTCDDEGVYTVTLTASDAWTGTASSMAQVTVSNVPPTIDGLELPSPILVDTAAVITATYSDPGAVDTHEFEIDWGDGAMDAGAASGGVVVAEHEYAGVGEYTVVVTVTDDDGAADSATDTIEVVENEAPTADASGPYSGSEGAAIALNGSGTDPDGDPLEVAWSVDSPLCAFSDSSVTNPELTCDDDGVYMVTLTVTDIWSATGSSGAQVTVNNVAPTIDGLEVPAGQILVGSTVTIAVTYSDSGAADTHTFDIAWGDGAVHSGAAVSGEVVAEHEYTGVGEYTVTVTVTDDDGDAGTAAVDVEIADLRTLLPVVLRR